MKRKYRGCREVRGAFIFARSHSTSRSWLAYGSGFRVGDLGFRSWGSGLRVLGF